jgi:hypothetical protein
MSLSERECFSRYKSPFNGLVAKCDLKGSHNVHRGDGFLWPDDKSMPYMVDGGAEPVVESREEPPVKKQAEESLGAELKPLDVIDAWKLDFYEGSALKYLARHRKKNGRKDIEKAIYYLELLLERQYT